MIRLLKLYSVKHDYDNRFSNGVICYGIWETHSMKETDKGRFFQLTCVAPYKDKVKVGDKRWMHEEVIELICDEIKITRHEIQSRKFPKAPNLEGSDTTGDAIITEP